MEERTENIDTDTTGVRHFTYKFHQEAARTPVDFHQQS
jgi:hypothetical protein